MTRLAFGVFKTSFAQYDNVLDFTAGTLLFHATSSVSSTSGRKFFILRNVSMASFIAVTTVDFFSLNLSSKVGRRTCEGQDRVGLKVNVRTLGR